MELRTEMKWKIGPDDEWTAVLKWYDDDMNGPRELVVTPTDPSKPPVGGLSQTVLREIEFTKAVDLIRKAGSFVAEAAPEIDWETIGGQLTEMSADGISDEYLAMLSLAYSASAGRTKKPVKYLGELMGRSPETIKSHLFQATRKKLLERSPGRAGGQVTLKALGLVNADDLTSNEQEKSTNNADEIEKLKMELEMARSHSETWRRVASELAEAHDVDKSAIKESGSISAET